MGDAADSGRGRAVNIEINVDTSKLDRMLADVPAALARAQKQALKDIGAEVVSQADRAFKHPHYRPSPWAPRKNNADPERPLLYKSGSMRHELKYSLDGDDTVVIGTPHAYAKYHQFGTKHMPARPFMPVDANGNLLPRVQRKIVKYVNDAVSAEIKSLFGR